MNRRTLLFASISFALASLPTLAIPPLERTIHRKLGPLATRIRFRTAELQGVSGPLVLRSFGNALWIEAVSWTGGNNETHNVSVKRNLPVGGHYVLPPMDRPTAITLTVTMLPLAQRHTSVELAYVLQNPST